MTITTFKTTTRREARELRWLQMAVYHGTDSPELRGIGFGEDHAAAADWQRMHYVGHLMPHPQSRPSVWQINGNKRIGSTVGKEYPWQWVCDYPDLLKRAVKRRAVDFEIESERIVRLSKARAVLKEIPTVITQYGDSVLSFDENFWLVKAKYGGYGIQRHLLKDALDMPTIHARFKLLVSKPDCCRALKYYLSIEGIEYPYRADVAGYIIPRLLIT